MGISVIMVPERNIQSTSYLDRTLVIPIFCQTSVNSVFYFQESVFWDLVQEKSLDEKNSEFASKKDVSDPKRALRN